MDTKQIKSKFQRMGASFKVALPRRMRWQQSPLPFQVDVEPGRHGESFVLRVRPGTQLDVSVADLQPQLRHLLLLVRQDGRRDFDRFLCGHDERSWFVAAVPGGNSVTQAMEALKPSIVRQAQDRTRRKMTDRFRRRNDAFVRQGEWFFVPQPGLVVDEWLVLRDEPMRRGAGKPHMAEYLYRTAGVTVYVSSKYPNGLTQGQYAELLKRSPDLGALKWRTMRRDAEVYVRGRVRHSDHKTIVLNGWHRVMPNTETQTRAMANVAFLD